jgi:hypothetical protein
MEETIKKVKTREEEASDFANENFSSYFDCGCEDYKYAWCEAYDHFMEGLV